jgi:hypothetical protein
MGTVSHRPEGQQQMMTVAPMSSIAAVVVLSAIAAPLSASGGPSNVWSASRFRTRVSPIRIFSVFTGKKFMDLPNPPSDLSRTEKKSFKKIVKTLVNKGVDPSTRIGLVEEYVRLETRLNDLRTSEKEAENTSKMAVIRALNVATSERRRLHDAIFRGATDAKPAFEAEVKALELEAGPDEAAEAWRRYRWWKDSQFTRDELEAKFGLCPLKALLYASQAEELAVGAALKATPRAKALTADQIADIRAYCGHPLASELRSPAYASFRRELKPQGV